MNESHSNNIEIENIQLVNNTPYPNDQIITPINESQQQSNERESGQNPNHQGENNDQGTTTNHQENQNNNPQNNQLSKIKKLILISIPVFIIIIVIVLKLVLKKKSTDENDKEKEFTDENGCVIIDFCQINPNNCIIERKLYEVKQYNESIEEITSIEFSTDNYFRRLSDFPTNNKKININYLFTIYSQENKTNERLYSAYAVILNHQEIINENEISSGGYNILINSEPKEDIPIINFKFNDLGQIYELSSPEKIDSTYLSYLIDFTTKIAPDLSNKVNNKGRRLQINDNQININQENDFSDGKTSFSDGKVNQDDSIQLSDKIPSKMVSSKEMNLFGNSSNQVDDIEMEKDVEGLLDLDDFKDDKDNIRKGLITGLKINSNSLTELISNEINENVSKKIKGLISNVKFNNEVVSRRLNNFYEEEELNKENYEKFKIPKVKSYKDLRKLVIAFKQPIQFSYGLFKTTKLGLKMALNAQVSFFPNNGTAVIKMVLVTDKEKKTVIEKKIETNFKKISQDIQNLVENLTTQLNIFNSFDFGKELENIGEQLKGNLSKLEQNLNNTKFISYIFDDELNDIGQYLKENFLDEKYKHLINKSEITYNLLENNKKNVKDLNSVKTIINKSNETFHNFYNNAYQKISNLEEKVNDFFSKMKNITDELKKKVFDIDIDLYYGIKDELNIINNIYSQFINKIKSSIKNEEDKFDNQTYQNFKDTIEPNLIEIEGIAQEMQFNDKVKEVINDILKNTGKENVYSQFENYRTIIYDTLNSMIQLVNNNNENELQKKDLNITYTKLINDIEEKQNELFEALESFINYNLNFTLYVQDMECFFNIEKEIYEKRKKGYIDYILKPFRQIEDTFLTTNILNNIKSQINQQFSKFKNLINNSDFNNLITELSNFLNIYNEIQKKYLGEEMISKTVERFNNTDLINNNLKEFYNSLNNSYKKYESECYVNHFKKHLDYYISKPEEILNKIEQINEGQMLEKNYTIGNVTNIILNEIKYSIKDSYIKIQNIIENEYDKMFNDIPRSKFKDNKEFNAFEELFEEIKTFNFSDEINILSLSEDPFNIKDLNNNSESQFYYDFSHLIYQIKHDYAFRFCDGEELYEYCPSFIKNDLLNEDQQYNSQISKARSVISQMKSTVILSTEFLSNEKTFSNLNSTEYYEYYKNMNNFKGDAIISDIISYVNELEYESEESIKPNIRNFSNIINQTFTKNLNIELIKNIIIQNITSNIFIIDDNITASLRKELSSIKSSIMRAFSAEKNYYSNSNNKYFSPSQSYYDSYDQLYVNIRKMISELGNIEISLNNELIDEIENVLKSRINDISSEIKKQIQLTSQSLGTFELLNTTFTLMDYSDNFLDENTNNLKAQLRKEIEKIYNNDIENFKSECQQFIDEQIKIVNTFLNDTFIATYTKLEQDVDLDSLKERIEITSLINETKDTIFNGYQNYIKKLIDLFNEKKLKNQFKKLQNDSINNLDNTLNLDDFQTSLTEAATRLKSECKDLENNENTKFKNEIQNIISKNFITSVKSFVENKGNEYLEEIFYEDFILNFMNDLNFIKIIIDFSNQYIKLILKTKNIISKNFGKTLEEIYPYLKEGIQKNIIPKIDSIVMKKLNDFNIDVKSKILNGFKDNTIDMLNSIKIKLSDKILNLIPEQFTQSFLVSLNKSLDEIFESNYFGEIKKNYKTNITNEIDVLSQVLDNYKEDMEDVISALTTKTDDGNNNLIFGIYQELNTVNKEFNNTFDYDLNDDIKESLEIFIDEINQYLLSLLGDYSNNVININKYLNDRINNYLNESQYYFDEKNNNFRDKISKKINKTEKLKEMNDIRVNINNLLNSIKHDTSYFQNILEKNIFKRNLVNNQRNLKEYNIDSIENIIQNYQKSLNDFAEKFLKSHQFLSIFSKRIEFIYSLTNNVESIYDYEMKFKNLLSNYASEETIKDYYVKLITIGKEQGEDLLTKSNNYIDKSLSNLNKIYLESLYSPIKNSIKKAVDTILEEKFNEILQSLEKIPNDNIDNAFGENNIEEANMNNEICLFGVCIITSINISQINYSYGLYYNTTDDTYINVEVFLNSIIIGNIRQNISNLFFETTNGTLANASMHIIPQYNLVNQKTYLKTLGNQFQGKYSIMINNYNNFIKQDYSLVEVANKSIEKVF